MNWNQIQYVIVTAEEKNMTHAAKKLYISQPSLSISINQLEKEIGIELFERRNGLFELTYAGKMFYEWAKSVMALQGRLQDHLQEIKDGSREKIRIGISPHRSTAVTPKMLKRIYETYPSCEIQLIEKPANELTALLETDQVDMIIDIPRTDTVTYHNEIITDEGMCLAVPVSYIGKSHFEQERGKVALEDLQEYGFIMLPEESYFGQTSRKCLQLAGIVPRIVCTCTFSETVRNLVAEQIGIALLPDFFSTHIYRSEQIRFYQVRHNTFRRQIAVVYRNDRYHSKMFMEIVEIIRQTFERIYSQG